jgi:hypothetical protein
MTSKKQLKARVRGRMAKTGESYTTALRHIVGAPTPVTDLGYTLRGGLHPETANIANVLAHHRIKSDGMPITEALVFGVSGGPGAGYILWEFKQHDVRIVTLAFQNQWQYPDAWASKTLKRLGVRFTADHTSGAAAAARRLSGELAQGRPCIIRPDRYHIGYWRLPEAMSGRGGHEVVAYAEADGFVHVDDRNVSPLLVRRSRLVQEQPVRHRSHHGTDRSSHPEGGNPGRPARRSRASRIALRLLLAARVAQVVATADRHAQRQSLAEGVRRSPRRCRCVPVDLGGCPTAGAVGRQPARPVRRVPRASRRNPARATARRRRTFVCRRGRSVASALDRNLPLDAAAVDELFGELAEALAEVYRRETAAHAALQEVVEAL